VEGRRVFLEGGCWGGKKKGEGGRTFCEGALGAGRFLRKKRRWFRKGRGRRVGGEQMGRRGDEKRRTRSKTKKLLTTSLEIERGQERWGLERSKEGAREGSRTPSEWKKVVWGEGGVCTSEVEKNRRCRGRKEETRARVKKKRKVKENGHAKERGPPSKEKNQGNEVLGRGKKREGGKGGSEMG